MYRDVNESYIQLETYIYIIIAAPLFLFLSMMKFYVIVLLCTFLTGCEGVIRARQGEYVRIDVPHYSDQVRITLSNDHNTIIKEADDPQTISGFGYSSHSQRGYFEIYSFDSSKAGTYEFLYVFPDGNFVHTEEEVVFEENPSVLHKHQEPPLPASNGVQKARLGDFVRIDVPHYSDQVRITLSNDHNTIIKEADDSQTLSGFRYSFHEQQGYFEIYSFDSSKAGTYEFLYGFPDGNFVHTSEKVIFDESPPVPHKHQEPPIPASSASGRVQKARLGDFVRIDVPHYSDQVRITLSNDHTTIIKEADDLQILSGFRYSFHEQQGYFEIYSFDSSKAGTYEFLYVTHDGRNIRITQEFVLDESPAPSYNPHIPQESPSSPHKHQKPTVSDQFYFNGVQRARQGEYVRVDVPHYSDQVRITLSNDHNTIIKEADDPQARSGFGYSSHLKRGYFEIYSFDSSKAGTYEFLYVVHDGSNIRITQKVAFDTSPASSYNSFKSQEHIRVKIVPTIRKNSYNPPKKPPPEFPEFSYTFKEPKRKNNYNPPKKPPLDPKYNRPVAKNEQRTRRPIHNTPKNNPRPVVRTEKPNRKPTYPRIFWAAVETEKGTRKPMHSTTKKESKPPIVKILPEIRKSRYDSPNNNPWNSYPKDTNGAESVNPQSSLVVVGLLTVIIILFF